MSIQATINVPKRIEVKDYHDFDEIKKICRLLFEGLVMVEDVGFSRQKGVYIGMLYQQPYNSSVNTLLRQEIKEEIK